MDKVTGVVQYIGTKFNGSLKINDTFYNLGKGVTHSANVGDHVTLTLKPWEYKGKSGVNVSNIDVLAGMLTPVLLPESRISPAKAQYEAQISFAKHMTEPKTDWAAKDRSQLVGGRSHDAAELAKVAIQTGTPMKTVLSAYAEALAGILKLAEEVK